jgi:type II secretory pathway predicted ATPase ExeA
LPGACNSNMVLHARKGAQLDALIVNPFAPRGDIPDQYASGSREQATTRLLRGIGDREVLQILSGPAYVGKSVVLSAVLAGLARKSMPVVSLDNSYTAHWSLRLLIGHILGRPVAGPIECEMAAAFAKLSTAPAGDLQIVVAVDDAQTLTDQALEYLLLIASLARGRTPLLQFILVGRGDFCDRRWPDEVAAITARFGVHVALEPFDDEGAADYVAHRLLKSGRAPGDLVTPSAMGAVLRHAAGLPGQIDRILAAAIDLSVDRFDLPLTSDIVEQAVASLEPPLELPHPQILARVTTSPPDDPAARPPDDTAARPNVPLPAAVALEPPSGPPKPQMPARATNSPPDDAATPDEVATPDDTATIVSVPLPAAASLAHPGAMHPGAMIEAARTGNVRATDPAQAEMIASPSAASSSVQILAPRMVVSQEPVRPHIGPLMISLAARRHPFPAGLVIAGCLAVGAFAVSHTHPAGHVTQTIARQEPTAAAPLTQASDTAAATPTAHSAVSMTAVSGAGANGAGQGATRAPVVAGSAAEMVAPPAGSVAGATDDVSAASVPAARDDYVPLALSLSPGGTSQTPGPMPTTPMPTTPMPTAPVPTAPVPTTVDTGRSDLATVSSGEGAVNALPAMSASIEATAPTPAAAPMPTAATSPAAETVASLFPPTVPPSGVGDLSPAAQPMSPPTQPPGQPPGKKMRNAANALPLASPLPSASEAAVPALSPPIPHVRNAVDVPQVSPVAQGVPTVADVPAVAQPSATAVAAAAVPEVSLPTQNTPQPADVPAVTPPPARAIDPVPEVSPLTQNMPKVADIPAVASPSATAAEAAVPEVPRLTETVPSKADVPAVASPSATAVEATTLAVVEAAVSSPATLSGADATSPPLARPAPPSVLSPQIVAALLRRGDALLREGDITAARLAYERAAAAGSGAGATGAGRTYDPVFLAGIDARGLQGDPVRAADWYRRALELGDGAATQALKTLLARSGR